MDSSHACKSCLKRTLVRDDVSGSLVCSSCGIIQDFDNFDAQLGGLTGPQGTFVRVGTSGTGTHYNYREAKISNAEKLINDLVVNRLGLTISRSNEIKSVINTLTEGEFGQGNWFPVLIGACAYVVMRKDNKSLPIAEVSSVIGCDDYELGRMVERVKEFVRHNLPHFLLGNQLPEVDIVIMFERVLRNSPSLVSVSRDKMERMRKQGVFLTQCAVKWFLTTGRRPLPMVVAVLVFVAQLNGVELRFEDAAKEVHAKLATCRLRHKELLKVLVKVAQALPWGKDVTVKNVVKNAPFVIQYMEMKSMSKVHGKRGNLRDVGFDVEDVVSECLRKDYDYELDENGVQNDSQYFEVEDSSGFAELGVDDLGNFEISAECLSMIYLKFLSEVGCVDSMAAGGKVPGTKESRGSELSACRDWWNGKSEMSKKLLLKQILEKDVGLDSMPPSFINGCMAYERRRQKIDAAKLRIKKIMQPPNMGVSGEPCLADSVHIGKKRKRGQANDVDWEDFIIETLLLHHVKEDDIERGHYNTLLDLHVFNSGVM